MSTQAGTFDAAAYGGEDSDRLPLEAQISSFLDRTLGRYFEIRPYEDGLTLLLLLGMLAAVAWSVQLAGWLNGPLTQPTVFFGGIMGILAARHRFRWPVAHLAAFAFGWIVVFWQASYGADGSNIYETTRDVWERFFIWLEAARNDGISRDPLPFELMLLSAAWVVSYLASWVLFKFRNVWVTVGMLGYAVAMNLSYRQGKYEYTLYIFLALAIVLFAHVTAIQRAATWARDGVRFPAHLRQLSIQFGVILSISVVVIAAVLPLYEPRSGALNAIWEGAKDPFRTLEDDFGRLLSGVRGNSTNGFGAFNETLPFTGSIKLPDDPVMFVDSVYPTLHAGRIYTEYSSQGWLTGPTIEQDILAGDVVARREDLKARQLITQRFIPNVNTDWLLPVGSTLSMNLDGTNEVLAPVEWILTMVEGDLGDLPPDVALYADSVRDEFLFVDEDETPPTGLGDIDSRLRELVPATLRPIAVAINDDGSLFSVRVGRSTPPPIEQISFTPKQEVGALESYIADQLISTATDDELDEAGTNYPFWVTDRYLQLPESLPARVGLLAQSIVEDAGAVTPFEKTVAIQDFLRNQGYSQSIEGPRPEADAVDYFLFETQTEGCPSESRFPCEDGQLKGYSQYFGSAMAVMLRSVGVPARMVAGYAAGTFFPQQARFVVRGSDRHGWAQAYFPGYGWIDVEATPGYTSFARGTPFSAQQSQVPGGILTPDLLVEQEFFPDEDLSQLEAEARLLALQAAQAGNDSGPAVPVIPIVVPIIAALALAIAGALTWNFGMGGLTAVERTYVKMGRLGRLAGLGLRQGQTPGEYARYLAIRIPTISSQAYSVAGSYQAYTYGHRQGDDDAARMKAAWKRIRPALLGRTLRRFTGL